MVESQKILIVDDDKTWQAFLSAHLQDKYSVLAAYDGDIGLKLAREWLPDLIFLDIEMPVKGGYGVCAELKADAALRDIPVIFLSGKSDLQEKITGFRLGADDYLIKPCEAEILRAKAARSIKLYHEKKALDEKAAGAQVLAVEAMNSSADLGRSVRFAERTYAMDSFDKLAEGLFQTMEEFGLDTSVMFLTDSGPQFYSHNGYDLSPLEKDMFQAIHAEGRFCDFGSRTFCNFNRASLLVKNMPEADPERYGRIKDTVPWILGTVDGKVGALNTQLALVAQHQKVSETLGILNTDLNKALQTLSRPVNAEAMAHLESSLALLEYLGRGQEDVQRVLAGADQMGQAESGDQIYSKDVDFF
ncbi:response regulator transcription factor [Cellvibrio sp.]|uniref:response regulator transcription factor n=1 Tax=Cellvibrio sp. TaxID=1965322 RepID=UPI003964795C